MYIKQCCSLPCKSHWSLEASSDCSKPGHNFFSVAFRTTSKSQSHYSTSQFAFDRKQHYPEGWRILLSRFSSCIFQVKEVIKEDLLYKHTCLFQLSTESSLKWGWSGRCQFTKTKTARGKIREAVGFSVAKPEANREMSELGGWWRRKLNPGHSKESKGTDWFYLWTLLGESEATVTLRRSMSFGYKLQKGGWLM